jgi:gliding motility-associated-like protein
MATPSNFNYVDSLLNWQSMCDYFVLNSYVVTQDWLNWNTAWWRGMDSLGDKRKWRYTLWDMDATFGHYINYTGIPDPSANADPCNVENLPNPGGQGHTEILQKLITENPVVKQYYVSRYMDMVNTYFSCSYMIQLLDSMVNEIDPEMTGQVTKWGGTYSGWQSKVQELRDYINLRCTALQQGMIGCYNLTGPFETTFNVSPALSGEIKVNSIWAPTYPWATHYFGGISTNLIAKAAPGYTFDHWEYTTGPLLAPIAEDTNGLNVNGVEHIVAVFIPQNPDLDGDGILNTDEVLLGTDPSNSDTDQDGESDSLEVGSTITNPLDSDGDGIIDALESSILDADNDGVSDEADPANEDPCIPNQQAALCDFDGDGLNFGQETTAGTNPLDPDTDHDGIQDGTELANGSNPLNPCDPDDSLIDCQFDDDGDGVTNASELSSGTDIANPCSYIPALITIPVTSTSDCDADGISDSDEHLAGSNPFDPCDPNENNIVCKDGIYIPTGFSPNGVGNELNEKLVILVGKNVQSFTLKIYDRWGNLMVSTTDKSFEWDGTYNGKPLNMGVYAYVLDVIFDGNVKETRIGNITLIR